MNFEEVFGEHKKWSEKWAELEFWLRGWYLWIPGEAIRHRGDSLQVAWWKFGKHPGIVDSHGIFIDYFRGEKKVLETAISCCRT